jgi:hypothetical protein
MNVCEENLAFGEQITFVDSRASHLMTILRIPYEAALLFVERLFFGRQTSQHSDARNGAPIQDFETGIRGLEDNFFGRNISRNLVSSEMLEMWDISLLFSMESRSSIRSPRKLFSRMLKRLIWDAFCAAKRPACSPKFTEGNVSKSILFFFRDFQNPVFPRISIIRFYIF